LKDSTFQVVANVGITIPSFVCKTLSAEPGQCLADADVLNINRKPGLLSATISETTQVQGQDNIVTLSFRTNMELIQGSRITLSGLRGSATLDSLPSSRAPLRDRIGQDYALRLIVSDTSYRE
jgi:hypothetical protein